MQRLQIHFLRLYYDEEVQLRELESWEICYIRQPDEYGRPLPERADGTQFLPDSQTWKISCIRLSKALNISYNEIIKMRYSKYVEMLLLCKAEAYIAPTKTVADYEREQHERRLRR